MILSSWPDTWKRAIFVLSLKAKHGEAVGHYTEPHGKFLDLVDALATVTNISEIGRQPTGFTNYFQPKERARICHAVLARVFGAGFHRGW